MYTNLMVSVDELWLKGKNRPLYFRAITKHIDQVIKTYHKNPFKSRNDSQRLNYSSEVAFDEIVIKAVLKIPGIANVSPVKIIERTGNIQEDIALIKTEAIKECEKWGECPVTFRVSVRRIDKRFSMHSVELEREVGISLLTKFSNIKTDLRNPERIMDIRVMSDKVSLGFETFKGMGGLPFETSGHSITMLSGGFDSPVASYMMMKRGLKQSFVFFYAYPFVGESVLEKLKSLVSELAKFQMHSHFYIVPFGEVQNVISKKCREEYRTLLFRKSMVDAANLIADKIGAQGIVTGDSLGQVSSQTLTNLSLIDKSSKYMIFRPLVGFNKKEVLSLAEQIGTHDISIIPHDDACALFAPKSPVTNANIGYWSNFIRENDFQIEISKAVDSAEVYSVNLKGELFKKDFFSFDSN
jgi:thiamine biosynthesis protein ThiI